MNRCVPWFPALLLLVSCASPPEPTHVCDLPVPEHWAAPAPNEPFVEGRWWESLGGPTLTALIREALEQNRDLRQAAARVDAAVAQTRIAGSSLPPQLTLNGDATRRQQVFVGLPIPGRENTPLSSRSTSYGVSLNVSWELDLWGRIRAGQTAALAELQAAEAMYRAAQQSLAAQTARAWLALVAAQQQCELARANRDSLARTADRIAARYREGTRTALEDRMARQNLASAEAMLAARERERDAALRQLEILLGRYPAGTITNTGALPPINSEVPAGLPSELLQRRPDLVVAERQLAAQLARVREARAALWPRISLTAAGGRISNELQDLLDSRFDVWSLAGNIAQPILQGGRLRANVRLAEARAREALENYASVMLRAFAEVETALAAEQHLRQRQAALEESLQQARAALRLAETRYQTGLVDYLTLLESQRALYLAESDLIEVQRQRWANRIDLYLALGGGFEPDPPGSTANVMTRP